MAPDSLYKVFAISKEAVLFYSLSMLSNFSFFIEFSSNYSRVTTLIEFSNSFGFLNSIENPPSPILFSSLSLAALSY